MPKFTVFLILFNCSVTAFADVTLSSGILTENDIEYAQDTGTNEWFSTRSQGM